jgi:hypothetical protein
MECPRISTVILAIFSVSASPSGSFLIAGSQLRERFALAGESPCATGSVSRLRRTEGAGRTASFRRDSVCRRGGELTDRVLSRWFPFRPSPDRLDRLGSFPAPRARCFPPSGFASLVAAGGATAPCASGFWPTANDGTFSRAPIRGLNERNAPKTNVGIGSEACDKGQPRRNHHRLARKALFNTRQNTIPLRIAVGEIGWLMEH